MDKHSMGAVIKFLSAKRSRFTADNSLPFLANLLVIALWLWFYRPVYPYLGIIFTRQEFRTNQILLLGVLLLIGIQVRKGGLHLSLWALPQRYAPALALALGSSAAFLFVERYLDINTLSASLFGLSGYGLLGLWLSRARWRQGLPAALLLIGALPFGEHLQTFVGYPVRIATASIVGRGLAALGVHSVGLETILVFENGTSQVDLPCSGVKSLWTGGMFLLAATWIERRPINLRWLLVALGFSLLLLAANLLRVAVLVAVGQVAGLILLAEMLHVPLGVLGFVASCAAAVFLLRKLAPPHLSPVDAETDTAVTRPIWMAPTLAGILLLMALFYTPRPQVALAEAQPQWLFPPEVNAAPWALTKGERQWLADGGVDQADRWQFKHKDISGSLLFVTSTTWRAHHRPERCFQVYGLTVDQSFTALISPDFPVRLLTLSTSTHKTQLSAAYWLQSPGQTTDDYAARIWSDLDPQTQRWVLVTVLFDQAVDLQSPQAAAFFEALRSVVQHGLEGETQP
jgi:exosortase O